MSTKIVSRVYFSMNHWGGFSQCLSARKMHYLDTDPYTLIHVPTWTFILTKITRFLCDLNQCSCKICSALWSLSLFAPSTHRSSLRTRSRSSPSGPPRSAGAPCPAPSPSPPQTATAQVDTSCCSIPTAHNLSHRRWTCFHYGCFLRHQR